MEATVADAEADLEKRRGALRDQRAYRRHMPALSDVDIYVLDKLEVLLQATSVLSPHHYAGTPEITSFLHFFGMSGLFLRPATQWPNFPRDLGMFQSRVPGDEPRVVRDEADLRAILETGQADLQLVHYDYPTYQHYNVVVLTGQRVGISPAKRQEIVETIHNSALLAALIEGNVA